MGSRRTQLQRTIRRIRPAFSRFVNHSALSAIAHSIVSKGIDDALSELRSETLRLRIRLAWDKKFEQLNELFGDPDERSFR